MSIQATIKGYSIILDLFNNSSKYSLLDFQNILESKDLKISKRTLQRYFEQLKNEFGIEIEYSKANNYYYLNKEKSLGLHSFYKFLELINQAQLIKKTLSNDLRKSCFIAFSRKELFKGLHLLEHILEAIINRNTIQFNHINYFNNTIKPYVFQPVLLKEYNSNWFVCGYDVIEEKEKVIGVDRIEDLQILSQKFKKSTFDFKTYFSEIVGVNFGSIIDEKLEFVEFELDLLNAKYVEAFPLHHSQEVIKRDDKNVTLRLYLKINFELEQLLLMRTGSIKILSPLSLKNSIIDKLKLGIQKNN